MTAYILVGGVWLRHETDVDIERLISEDDQFVKNPMPFIFDI